ncbi:MAG: HAD family hydrolase [Anaerolineae bacterium]|nr:HAD family hydrolase [Anaerolineae bacterium]
MALRGVIFDMGGTLLHYTTPNGNWEDTEKIGARGVYHCLRERGYTLPPEDTALDAAWDFAESVWQTLLGDYNVDELKLAPYLVRLAGEWGVDGLPPDIGDTLAQAYMSSVQACVHPLAGVQEMLRGLQDRGLRIGLISNTTWPGEAHRYDLDRFGLIPFLDHLVFSADAAAWKPDSAVFRLSLSALNLEPGEACYVGDSLIFDVWGAQRAGMRGVWIEQAAPWVPDGMTITPDATIATLPELLDIVDDWR